MDNDTKVRELKVESFETRKDRNKACKKLQRRYRNLPIWHDDKRRFFAGVGDDAIEITAEVMANAELEKRERDERRRQR